MDIHNEANNEFISEEAWKKFVKWYGINQIHHLDRKHLYFKDEKVFDVCILTPFSGITEHRVKKFNRFDFIELLLIAQSILYLSKFLLLI